jgi:magnesium chelatase family protein
LAIAADISRRLDHRKARVNTRGAGNPLNRPSRQPITINLAPTDVRKEGPSLDLPVALGMLKLEKENRVPDLDAFCISGELALSG